MSEEKKEAIALRVAKFFEKFFDYAGYVIMFFIDLLYKLAKVVFVVAVAAVLYAISDGQLAGYIGVENLNIP